MTIDMMICLWTFQVNTLLSYIIIYNPDKIIDKYCKSKNPMFSTRMDVLEKAMDKQITKQDKQL